MERGRTGRRCGACRDDLDRPATGGAGTGVHSRRARCGANSSVRLRSSGATAGQARTSRSDCAAIGGRAAISGIEVISKAGRAAARKVRERRGATEGPGGVGTAGQGRRGAGKGIGPRGARASAKADAGRGHATCRAACNGSDRRRACCFASGHDAGRRAVGGDQTGNNVRKRCYGRFFGGHSDY